MLDSAGVRALLHLSHLRELNLSSCDGVNDRVFVTSRPPSLNGEAETEQYRQGALEPNAAMSC